MAEEKTFENKVKEYLDSQECWYLKYWAGGGFTKSGIPDLLVCCSGHFLGVEIKASKGKPSLLQLRTLRQIEDAGGYGILLYPEYFEVFKNLILCIKLNDQNAAYNYDIFRCKRKEWEDRLINH